MTSSGGMGEDINKQKKVPRDLLMFFHLVLLFLSYCEEIFCKRSGRKRGKNKNNNNNNKNNNKNKEKTLQ